MTAEAHTPPAGGISPAKRLQMNRLGLWLFLLSETFLFGGILAARFYLWGATRPHLDQILGLSVTAMLLVSSFFINRAEVAIKHDDRIEFLRSTGITILLGLLFLVGVVGLEWRTAPVNPATGGEFGIYGDVLFFMTGMHAFHVLTGVILLGVVAYLGYKGHFHARNFYGVEAAAIYWHFVDLVWVFFYPALYLMGVAVGPGH
ncbi:MAG: heme-copper oxidase subunit III [Caldilineales bacterium]|nr:heme-copper oxidase subunit III [Caldilineales bacterium]